MESAFIRKLGERVGIIHLNPFKGKKRKRKRKVIVGEKIV